jgi:hypothetical protein
MTSQNIYKHIPLLEQLAHKRHQKQLIKNAEFHLMTALCDLVHNVLQGNINITEKDRKKLIKYKNQLRHMCKHSTLEHKKKYLLQKGGFLQYIIPAAIAGISSIISSWVSKSDNPQQ